MLLCGLDEAGCGPLAGPVVAGCVILGDGFPAEILSDSKRLTHNRRAQAKEVILRDSCWGLGIVGEKTIDEVNILQARLLAMKKAFEDMAERLPQWAKRQGITLMQNTALPDGEGTKTGGGKAAVLFGDCIEAIADGTFCPALPCPVRCEAKADGKYPAVMAASIIAKEERDDIMVKMDALYPQYGYAKHKGYPTKEHIKVLHEIGPSPIQRMSFHYR